MATGAWDIHMKITLIWIIAIVAVTTFVIAEHSDSTDATTNSDDHADGTSWNYDPSTKILTISGNGPMEDYSSTTAPWADIKSDIETIMIMDSVTSVGAGAFKDCSSLKTVNLPNSVTTIGENAFYNCGSLSKVEFGDSLTSVGDYAFANCTSLVLINLPNTIRSIGFCAFYVCPSLTTVHLSESLESLGEAAFYECSAL